MDGPLVVTLSQSAQGPEPCVVPCPTMIDVIQNTLIDIR